MATTTTSKQFWLNARDFIRALAYAMAAPVVPIIIESMNAKLWVFDWTTIWHTSVSAGVIYLAAKFFTPAQTITTPARILLFLACFGLATAGHAQILKPLPKPDSSSNTSTVGMPMAMFFADTTYPTPTKDSTYKGVRLTGLSLLYGLTDGYTASNVYAGTGFGYEHATYRAATKRWYVDWSVGVGVYAGGMIAPKNLQAVTAVGVNVALFNKFLLLGVLYNLNSPNGQRGKWVGAVGGNAALIPTN